jgi:hypothetical protein
LVLLDQGCQLEDFELELEESKCLENLESLDVSEGLDCSKDLLLEVFDVFEFLEDLYLLMDLVFLL